MKFLADENFPRPALLALRQAGFDVLSIAETNAGALDDEVLNISVSSNRTLLTFDKDFGELAFRWGMPAQCGVILFRVTPKSPEEITVFILAVMKSQPVWRGYFSVVTRERLRMRPLPSVQP